MAHFEATYRAP